MEWNPSLTTLYDKIVQTIPEQFRNHVGPLLRQAAEAQCEKRGDTRIREADLVTGLFEITPVTFKPRAAADLEALGIDLGDLKAKYSPLADLKRMEDDIVTAAGVAGAPCSRETVRKVLDAYAAGFSRTPVTFRTTTKPPATRRLGVRFVQVPGPESDPYPVAIDRGFLERRGRPLDDLLAEIHSEFSIIGYGLDMDAELGVAKIWPFLETLSPIENAFRLVKLPRALAKHAGYFAKYGLKIFSLFALDYLHETVNVYFMLNRPGLFTPAQIAGMHADLGLPMPSPELVERCGKAFALYYTFGYDSDRVERICFGVAAPDPRDVPTHLDPLIATFSANVPFVAKDRRFIYSITTGRAESYIKIEADYTGSMIELLTFGAHAVESVSDGASSPADWRTYLGRLFEELNALPELPPILSRIAPLLFQYRVTDRPEMSYWQLMERDGIRWGPGRYEGQGVPTVVHMADFETIRKVNAGELDPIGATATGQYVVEGDLSRLVAAAPLLPLNPKAHARANGWQGMPSS